MISTVVCLCSLGLTLAYAPVWDGPVPEIPELKLPADEQVAPDDNAYEVFRSFVDQTDFSRFDALKDWRITDPESTSLDRQLQVLESAQPLADLVDAMLRKPKFYQPILDPDKRPEFAPWLILHRYLDLRTNVALRRDDRDKAVRLATEALQFATRLAEGQHGSLVHTMIAAMFLGQAVENAGRVIQSYPETVPAPLIKQLLKVPDMRRLCWRGFCADHQYGIESAKRSTYPRLRELGLVLRWGDPARWLDLPTPPLLYQPMNTVRMLGETFLQWRPYLLAPPERRAEIPPPDVQPDRDSILNLYGRRLANLTDGYAYMIKNAQNTEARARAYVLIPFLLRNKRPPDAWILDPFTGRPLWVSDDGSEIRSAGMDRTLGTEDDLVVPVRVDSP